MKRLLCIVLSVIVLMGAFVGCKQEQPITQEALTQELEEENVSDTLDNETMVTEDNKEENNTNEGNATCVPETSNTENVKVPAQSSTKKDNNKTSSTKPNNKTPNVTTTKESSNNKPTTSSSTKPTTSTPTTTTKPSNKPSDNNNINNYPTLTEDYIFPGMNNVRYSVNSSNIYENKYVKIDATTAKKGYLLITYKDPWADKIWIAIDETATHSGQAVQTHHFYYNKGEFTLNQALTINLPKTDAIYYISISSETKGSMGTKMLLDLGQVTVDGAVSYQDMVPSEQEIKLVQTEPGVYSNKYVSINTNTANRGYLEVNYLEPNGFDIEVFMTANVKNNRNNNAQWEYKTGNKGKCKIIAGLTYGNAEYSIKVSSTMVNNSTGVGRASDKAKLTVGLNNVSSTGAFLLSNSEVIFNSNMQFIKKANEIAATCSNDLEKVSKIYDWLTDYLGIGGSGNTALGVYKCNLETVYNRKTGVCYDFAVVLAAMLRSQGIPCKVVFGDYTNSSGRIGHAWNEVYVQGSGTMKTNKLSITGNTWCRLDPMRTAGNSSESTIEFMNNSSNYVWEYYY